MNRLGALKSELVSALQKQLEADRVQVTGEFPSAWRQSPARRSCVSVGFGGAEFPDGASGQVKLTLRFDILCPPGAAPGCHTVFEQLCEALLTGRGMPRVGAIRCEGVSFNAELGCLTMEASATMSGFLSAVQEGDGEPFTDIFIQTKGV